MSNLVEINSYQKGIDYERKRIKRIIKKWMRFWDLNHDSKQDMNNNLFKLIEDFEVEK